MLVAVGGHDQEAGRRKLHERLVRFLDSPLATRPPMVMDHHGSRAEARVAQRDAGNLRYLLSRDLDHRLEDCHNRRYGRTAPATGAVRAPVPRDARLSRARHRLRLGRAVAQQTVLPDVSRERPGGEMPDALRCFPVRIRPAGLFSDEQFYEFCRLNSDLDIERTAQGDLLIMAPASFRSSHINLRIVVQLDRWAERDGTGVPTESSGGFILPNSAVRAGCRVDSTRPPYGCAAGAAGPFSSRCARTSRSS